MCFFISIHSNIYIYIYIYIYVCVCVCVCVCEGHSKSSEPHPEWRAIVEHVFSFWQHTTTFYKTRKTNSDFSLHFCTGKPYIKMRGNLKMDKREAWVVIKYLPKKGGIPKEIHENRVLILAEHSLSYVIMKNWAAEFELGRDSTEDVPQSGHS